MEKTTEDKIKEMASGIEPGADKASQPDKPKRSSATLKPPQQKRKRGRPKREPTPEEREQQAIDHWSVIGVNIMTVASAIVETKYPGCGPSQEEIENCSESLGWILNDIMPGEDDRSMHWGAVLMTLVVPTGFKIAATHKARKIHGDGVSVNGVHVEGAEKKKAKT